MSTDEYRPATGIELLQGIQESTERYIAGLLEDRAKLEGQLDRVNRDIEFRKAQRRATRQAIAVLEKHAQHRP